MIAPDDYLKKLKELQRKLLDESERIIYANENDILKLNIQNIDNHRGSDGNKLINDNPRYSGRYTYFTQQIASFEKPIAKKIEGQLYNWAWTGDFLSNFQLEVLPNLVQIEIYSTGTGTGRKAEFFKGYKNLYGLDKDSQYKLNYEILYPEIMEFINKYI